MGFAEALVAFVVVGLPTIAIFALVSRVLRHREKKLEFEAQIEAAKAAATNPRPDLLEQRVRVLERIVTDKGMNVAEEIERLRDDRGG
ncbi:MAG TPA: hypothetical protein VGW40_03120 [Allosphingosinicella sp.]|nr:hypothetical protein [Allosphingosinicella sp.]